MSTLLLEDVHVAYGGAEVVRGVSALVEGGEWLALVGPNGSGKTSTLRAVSGLVRYGGRILIDGEPASGLGRRALARKIALVPQQPARPVGMRVGTYVLLGRTPHLSYFGRERSHDHAVVDGLLCRLAITHLVERPLESLSGGESQLVTLARALAQEPSVLLLDEPTTALDIGRQQEVMELVEGLRLQDGIAVMSAMHDLTQAGQYADRMLMLSRGQQVVSGSVAQVLTKEAIEEHYRASVLVSAHPTGGVNVTPTRRSRDDRWMRVGSGSAGENPPLTDDPPTRPPIRPGRTRVSSLVLVNTGEGKGKSTAAFGVIMRAISREWRVCVVQFIKSGRWRTGEEAICRRLGVDWWTIGDGFTWESDDLARSEAVAQAAWTSAAGRIASGEYDLVVLDEITYAMNWGWIPAREVLDAIGSRPAHVNIVATGRDASKELIELADTATEMLKLRHAYDRGVAARRGIDF